MIPKFGVLFRIQHFQQGRGRVAMEVENELVNFVQHKDRVTGFNPAQGLQNPTGEAPM